VRLLAATTGVFTEAAGGVAVAALVELAQARVIDPEECVVVVITGDGLKTLEVARDREPVHEIAPTLSAFEEAYSTGRSQQGPVGEGAVPA
jgi:threonine synthase